MGDARGELTDRLKLARVGQIDLNLSLFGEIPDCRLKRLSSAPFHAGQKHGAGKLLAANPFVRPIKKSGAFSHRRANHLLGHVVGRAPIRLFLGRQITGPIGSELCGALRPKHGQGGRVGVSKPPGGRL